MHSHQRTLLSSLGFSDPDKKNRHHDYACQYLCEPENANRLMQHLRRDSTEDFDFKLDDAHLEVHLAKGSGQYQSTIGFLDALLWFRGKSPQWLTIEHLGRYGIDDGSDLANFRKLLPYDSKIKIKPIAGTDAFEFLLSGTGDEQEELRSLALQHQGILKKHGHVGGYESEYGRAIVEVKINPLPIGDIMRQIELYRTYLNSCCGISYWVLATPFGLDASDTATLLSSKIHHIRLGGNFEKYAQRRELESQPQTCFEL